MDAALVDMVRQRDPDRYFCALFAPGIGRAALLTLTAFNHELARALEVTREPGLALIRLQWWREVVEGAARAHDVATPLAGLLAAGTLPRGDLLAMIEAREREVEADDGLAGWRARLLTGPGSLAVAAGRALGAPEEVWPRLRALGAGYGAAGQIGNMPSYARQGRCLLPKQMLAEFGLSPEQVIADPLGHATLALRQAMAFVGRALLAVPHPAGRPWLAAGLPAVFARRDLRRAVPHREASDRLAVALAALRGAC